MHGYRLDATGGGEHSGPTAAEAMYLFARYCDSTHRFTARIWITDRPCVRWLALTCARGAHEQGVGGR